MKYDVIIIGAGPGGIFSAYELVQQNPDLKIAVFESGHPLEKRHCPIDGDKIKSCINCKSCSIMRTFAIIPPHFIQNADSFAIVRCLKLAQRRNAAKGEAHDCHAR